MNAATLFDDAPASLRAQIERGLGHGELAGLRALFIAYADLMEARLDAVTAELTRLDALSLTDPLTGIPNRRALDMRLAEDLAEGRRSRRHIGVVFVDIDNFKGYNDRYGHAAGDATLRLVTDALTRALLRPSDFVARYGGEEFVAVLPGANTAGTHEVAVRMRAALLEKNITHDANEGRGVVTACYGVASIIPNRDAGSAAETLLRFADEALQGSKNAGRDRITIYETITGKMVAER